MGGRDTSEYDRYYPDEDRALSTAILETIEAHRQENITKADFQLYDDIDPDALDNLFRKRGSGDTTVEFDTDDVTVTLQGDGAVDIEITPRDDEA